jgi:Flp pilus assembly protein TadG
MPGAFLRRWATSEAGTTVVEFALVLPVLVTFIFGIWFIGAAYNGGTEAGHAVELASRIYVTNPSATLADLQTAVSSHLISVPISSVNLTSATVTIGSAQSQHITWAYSTTAAIPFISAIPFNFHGTVDVPLATTS